MTTRKKIDFSLLRRHNSSSTSLSELPPTVPTLESPLTFHAMTKYDRVTDSPLKRDKMGLDPATPAMFVEGGDVHAITSDFATNFAADPSSSSLTHGEIEREPPYRSKSQYFDNAFNLRGSSLSPRTRLSENSLVVVELRIKDDYSLAAVIASRLARIYQKPDTSMMVHIQHSACLHFGNPKQPSYLIKVFALPYMIAPITNLRSTVLIQTALQQILRIPPDRGIVLYSPISDENLATSGTTMSSEIARLEHRSEDEDPGILRTISRSMSRRLKSSSTNSAPISDATTSSWPLDSEPSATDNVKGACGRDTRTSDMTQGTVKKSRSIRRFLSRGHSEPSQATEDPN
ncbi:hypothetical protein HFD88_000659 [Aspergillus terreus]|nr:hypothetical protein HFD88_000659 [Aspergillus terreus]